MSITEHRRHDLESMAQSYNKELERHDGTDGIDAVIAAKKCSEHFLHQALTLPGEEQNVLLRAAQSENDKMRANDHWLPALDIVFSASTHKLAEFKLTYMHPLYNTPYVRDNVAIPEAIDLYRP